MCHPYTNHLVENQLWTLRYSTFRRNNRCFVAYGKYCEHAIVANPGDGDALALYAGLVWETTRDTDRTDAYFTRGRGPATARPPPPSRLLDVVAP